VSEARYLGIDIGGTKVSFRVVNGLACSEDDVCWHSSTLWPAPPVSVEDDLALLREQISQVRHATRAPITAVGVAIAGTTTPTGHVLAWPNRPMWTGTDLASALRTLIPEAHITWDDDGALATVAEARAAAVSDLVYVGVGTGIGSGIVIEGQALSAGSRGTPELGHLIVNHSGALCACGRRGCVQAESSGPATLRRAGAARGATVAFDELRSGWIRGEPWAQDAVRHSCAMLASALAGVGELTRPAIHVVGGGFAAAVPGFVDEIRVRAAALSRPGHPVAPIVPARFGGQSSLHGAVLAAQNTERSG
jgi:kanosamine 6-kinase